MGFIKEAMRESNFGIKVPESSAGWLILFSGFYSALVVISNVLAFKIIKLIFYMPAGVLTYPLTFLITDLVSEIFGKKHAKNIVKTGILVSILYVFVVKLAIFITPAEFFGAQEAFAVVLNRSIRITIAGLIAFTISQSIDVEIFHFWRRVTGKPKKWVRNNLSTIPSQLVDTVVFITLAFGGIYPASRISAMILGQFAVKFLFAIADTPFFYIFSSLLERKLSRDEKAGLNMATGS